MFLITQFTEQLSRPSALEELGTTRYDSAPHRVAVSPYVNLCRRKVWWFSKLEQHIVTLYSLVLFVWGWRGAIGDIPVVISGAYNPTYLFLCYSSSYGYTAELKN